MSWIEVVTVRTAGKTEFIKALEFFRQMNESLKADEKLRVKVFRNFNYDLDLSIHIYRDCVAETPAKTACGIRLCKLLSRFGIADHSVWQPVQLEKNS